VLHGVNDLRGDMEDKRSSNSVTTVFPIKIGDDIEEGTSMSLFQGTLSKTFNEVEAVDNDDRSGDNSNPSLHDSSSIYAGSNQSGEDSL